MAFICANSLCQYPFLIFVELDSIANQRGSSAGDAGRPTMS
jgi:hypothetical protein